MQLLKNLCEIQAPSGDEEKMTQFILDYIEKESPNWLVSPEVYYGDNFQNCIVLKFGEPTTALFAHMDSIGFTVRYGKELVKIGGPRTIEGSILVGEDSKGPIECELLVIENEDGPNGLEYVFDREIDRGTNLTFKCNFIETEDYVQSCYLDNRLGVWNALKLAETLENGIICFSCWEEHGGGSVGYLAKYMFEDWEIRQALISDITWVTEGVKAGEGVAISLRDSGIPRRSYLNRIVGLAKESGVPFQLEIESSGGSDGNELQKAPYPFDWCFIGAPEQNVHSPEEKVHKKDIEAMLNVYKYLMQHI